MLAAGRERGGEGGGERGEEEEEEQEARRVEAWWVESASEAAGAAVVECGGGEGRPEGVVGEEAEADNTPAIQPPQHHACAHSKGATDWGGGGNDDRHF